MKKAFTLIELLVVIAIIAILAAMLMPALQRARTEAQMTDCRYKVRQVGVGFELFRTDHNGVFPGWVGRLSQTDGTFLDELRNNAYWNPPDSDQSAFAQHRRAKAKYAAVIPRDGGWEYDESVAFAEYGYDIGRVSKNSAAGRGYYGDTWSRSMCWSPDWGWWDYNHPEGANLVFVDGSVEWCDKVQPDMLWNVYTHWCYWWRSGYITNPRMDEDVNRLKLYQSMNPAVTELDLLYPRDNDDIYACEGSSGSGATWVGLNQDPTAVPFPHCYAGNPKAPNGTGNTRNVWGDSALSEEPGGSEDNRNYVFYGDPSGNRCRHYPEVGPFADEGRWDTHDCRLVPIGWRLPSCYSSDTNPH